MRRRAIASVFGLLAFLWGAFASAQEIRIDVGGQPTGGGVPPVFQFGGGVWRIPKVIPWVAPSILDLRSAGGTYRAALSWEVLAASQSLDDLKSRLASYRLNDFLSDVKAKGGQVIISIDAMPKWLAADKSETKMADGPAWAKSVPASGEQWAAVVQATVAHFNGKLGLDAFYEVWNEPDWSLRGSLDQYLELYRWSVIGAKRADSQARMAGPALSDWTSPGASGKFFLQSFLDYAARTPAPEVGLKRLPIDAVTWHAFYRDHAVSYDLAATQIRKWLSAACYSGKTKLILDEWNIASAEPPYPEGDLNGTFAGAVYVAATLMAMNQAGIDRQTFQMMVDPGSRGYSGGAFTFAGVPRPNFNAFRMFAWLRGKQLPVTTSQEWVRSVAFADAKQVYLIVAVAPPTDYMLARGALEALPVENYGVYKELGGISKDSFASFLLKNGPMPAGLSPAAQEVATRARDQIAAARQERDNMTKGIKLQISLDAGLRIKVNTQRAMIDRNHAPDAEALDRATNEIQAKLKEGIGKIEDELERRDVQLEARDTYMNALKGTLDTRQAIESADPSSRAVLQQIDQQLNQGLAKQLSEINQSHLKKLVVDPLGAGGPVIELQSDALALHYFVFER